MDSISKRINIASDSFGFLLICMTLTSYWATQGARSDKVDHAIQTIDSTFYETGGVSLLIFLGGIIYNLYLYYKGGYNTSQVTLIISIIVSLISGICIISGHINKYFVKGEHKCHFALLPVAKTLQKEIDDDLPIDTVNIYKFIYGITLLYIIIFSKNKCRDFVLFFGSNLFLQILNSAILKQFMNNENIYPSIFTYLNEIIINRSRDYKGSYLIYVGIMRLFLLLILSLYIVHYLYLRMNYKSREYPVIYIFITYIVFYIILAIWQLLIGDYCIMERTIDYYKDTNFKTNGDALQSILSCSLQNQGGLYLNLLLLGWLLKYQSMN